MADVPSPQHHSNTTAGAWYTPDNYPATARVTNRGSLDNLMLVLLASQLSSFPNIHPRTAVLDFGGRHSDAWGLHSNNVCKFDTTLDLIGNLGSLQTSQALQLTRRVGELSAPLLSRDKDIQDCFHRAKGDAVKFAARLPKDTPLPSISISEDGEIVFDWRWEGKRALVDFDGDGSFGYALLRNGRFEPGAEAGDLAVSVLPADFRTYFRNA